jgi:hypothetical protein
MQLHTLCQALPAGLRPSFHAGDDVRVDVPQDDDLFSAAFSRAHSGGILSSWISGADERRSAVRLLPHVSLVARLW